MNLGHALLPVMYDLTGERPQVLRKRLCAGVQCGTVASPLLTSRYQTSGTSNSDVVDSAAVQKRRDTIT